MCDRRTADDAPASGAPLPDRSRDRIEEALARLRRDYGAFEVVTDVWTVGTERHERTRERFEAGTIGGAGAWVRDEDGAVLLIRERGVEAWSEPAGKHEPGETLAETARREVAEETGVDCAVTDVALVQRVRMEAPGRPPLYRLVVTFDARYTGGDPEPAAGEIDAVRWWRTRPPTLEYDALERLPIPAPPAD